MVQSAIPWWLGVIQWLAGLETVGAFFIIGFMFLLKWVGEIS